MFRTRKTRIILLTGSLLVAITAITAVYYARQAGSPTQSAVSKRPRIGYTKAGLSQPAANLPSTSSQLSPTPVGSVTPPASAGRTSPAAANAVTPPAASPAPAVAADHALTLLPSATNPRAGDELTVSLYENSGAEAVNAVQAEITYNSNLFSYQQIDPPADFSLDAATNTTTAGIIRLARATTGSPLTGQHLVARLHFKISAAASGNQTIKLDSSGSYIIRAADATDILQTVSAANLTINN